MRPQWPIVKWFSSFQNLWRKTKQIPIRIFKNFLIHLLFPVLFSAAPAAAPAIHSRVGEFPSFHADSFYHHSKTNDGFLLNSYGLIAASVDWGGAKWSIIKRFNYWGNARDHFLTESSQLNQSEPVTWIQHARVEFNWWIPSVVEYQLDFGTTFQILDNSAQVKSSR